MVRVIRGNYKKYSYKRGSSETISACHPNLRCGHGRGEIFLSLVSSPTTVTYSTGRQGAGYHPATCLLTDFTDTESYRYRRLHQGYLLSLQTLCFLYSCLDGYRICTRSRSTLLAACSRPRPTYGQNNACSVSPDPNVVASSIVC